MSVQDFGEPWAIRPGIDNDGVRDWDIDSIIAKGRGNETVLETPLDDDAPYAERAVACVNAMEGMNPEALGDLLRVLALEEIGLHTTLGKVLAKLRGTDEVKGEDS